MSNDIVQIKMILPELEGLRMAYAKAFHEFNAENKMESLLLVHAKHLAHKIDMMWRRQQYKNTIALTEPEAMAYYEWWLLIHQPLDTFCANAVQKIFVRIDGKHANAKALR